MTSTGASSLGIGSMASMQHGERLEMTVIPVDEEPYNKVIQIP